jgi:hypothetical protein
MKNIHLLIMLLILFATPFSVSAAGQVKVKYLGSIYADAEGVALKQPAGVSFQNGRLLIADSGGKRVVSYIYQDGKMKPDKSYALPEMYPLMAQQAHGGGFYILDGRQRQIVIVSSSGLVEGKFTPKGLPDGARIVPRSIKSGRDGSLLILDVFSERVLLFSGSGELLRQIPFPDKYKVISDVATDGQGNVYLLDSVQAVVYKARADNAEFEPLSESMKGNMNFPTSLTIDRHGNLYLVDKYGGGLDVISADGHYVGRKVNMGWGDSYLFYPSQVSVSDTGDLFVADTGNHRAQHFIVTE